MSIDQDRAETTAPAHAQRDLSFGSNAVRLSGRQWAAAILIVLVVLTLAPMIWRRLEPFEPGTDYRIPYALSNDYWQYARYCRKAAASEKTLVLGDSVVWGEYVTPQETLCQHLNALCGKDRFLNLGVNGIHPVALAGLIEYYGRAIAGRKVVLHYNPLWMSSDQHDLRTEKETNFNHPRLVPQFTTAIPCYKEPNAARIGIVMERFMPFRGWMSHLAIAYFDNMDLAAWARENPYGMPWRQITLRLPEPSSELRHAPVPWHERGIGPTDFEWVPPEQSLQWRFFRASVHTLLSRGNRVFVLVGPFNEAMMTGESRARYREILETIEGWLREQDLPCLLPPALPGDLCADASHPLSEGYRLIAQRLAETPSFKEFLE